MEDSRSAEASRRVFVSFNKIGGLGVPEFILMGWEGWVAILGHLRVVVSSIRHHKWLSYITRRTTIGHDICR